MDARTKSSFISSTVMAISAASTASVRWGGCIHRNITRLAGIASGPSLKHLPSKLATDIKKRNSRGSRVCNRKVLRTNTKVYETDHSCRAVRTDRTNKRRKGVTIHICCKLVLVVAL